MKNFLSRSPRLTYLPEHLLKVIFRNPGIEGRAEQVHAKVERKAQTEHYDGTNCLFGATRLKKALSDQSYKDEDSSNFTWWTCCIEFAL